MMDQDGIPYDTPAQDPQAAEVVRLQQAIGTTETDLEMLKVMAISMWGSAEPPGSASAPEPDYN